MIPRPSNYPQPPDPEDLIDSYANPPWNTFQQRFQNPYLQNPNAQYGQYSAQGYVNPDLSWQNPFAPQYGQQQNPTQGFNNLCQQQQNPFAAQPGQQPTRQPTPGGFDQHPMGPPVDQVRCDTAISGVTNPVGYQNTRLDPGGVPLATVLNLGNLPGWWGYYVDDSPKKREEKATAYAWRMKRARVNMAIERRVFRNARGQFGKTVWTHEEYVT